jgi:hypothetical protein
MNKQETVRWIQSFGNSTLPTANNMADSVLGDIYDIAVGKKARLNEILGIDNEYREITTNEERPVDASTIRETMRDICGSLPMGGSVWGAVRLLLEKGVDKFITADTFHFWTALGLAMSCEMTPPKVGQKSSRYLKQILEAGGVYKESQYARMADALSPKIIRANYRLTTSLWDFCSMSHGDTVKSCYGWAKNSPYSGMHRGSTWGYATDRTTFMLVVDDYEQSSDLSPTPFKKMRQLFHLNPDNGVLAQGIQYGINLVYPDNLKEYAMNRHIVQEIVADGMGHPNLWINEGYVSVNENYNGYVDATFSGENGVGKPQSVIRKLKAMEDIGGNRVIAGSACICPACGDTFESGDEKFYCYDCSPKKQCHECGGDIEEDEGYWIDGLLYCGDCVFYCCECEEYHLVENSVEVVRRGYSERVCEDCCSYYYTECKDCGQYYKTDTMHETTDDEHLCRDCFESGRYWVCENCNLVTDDSVDTVEGETYCQSCADDNLVKCEECGCWSKLDGAVKLVDATWLCEDCAEKEEVAL